MNKFADIIDGMRIVDSSLDEGGYNYYGYLRHNGEWAIMRQNAAETEYRYKIGASGYSTAWTNHATLPNYRLPIIG